MKLTHTHTHTHMRARTHTHTHMRARTHTHIRTHTRTYIYIYVYILQSSVMSVTLSSLPGKFKCSLLNSFLVLMELLPTPV